MSINNKNIKARPEQRRRVVVAMSGGVDSSVAAALLKRDGFDVVGVFMKFWRSPELAEGKEMENRCCSIESEKLARLVAKKIGIPFYVVNVEKEFKKKVVDYFLKEYKKGNTPNPCVVCNKEIKFGLLIEKALKMGADYIATGHYAKLVVGSEVVSRKSKLQITNYKLQTARDTSKDQSYFLWQLNQKQLSKVLFPVGNYTKPKVRKLAEKFDLPTAKTPESQEVCFVQNSTNGFLKKYLKLKPGPVIEQAQNGVKNIIGQHNGLWFYTIGQRRGIEVQQGPWYVVAKDFKNNSLIISRNKKDLLQKELVVKNVNWISGKEPKLPIKVKVKIRYRAKSADAVIFQISNFKFQIRFDKLQLAITPGQSAVFYLPRRSSKAETGKGEELLGGGIIDKVL